MDTSSSSHSHTPAAASTSTSPSNTYTHTSGEIPRLPEVVTRQHYDEWSLRMRAYLDARDLLDVVLRGVQGMPKTCDGAQDTTEGQAAKLQSTPENIRASKHAYHILMQSLTSKHLTLIIKRVYWECV